MSASDTLDELATEVHNARLESYTSAKKTRLEEIKTQGSNAPPPGGSSSRAYDGPSTARKLSDAGYEVLRVPEIPGFTPLYPVRSYFFLYSQPLNGTITATADSQSCETTDRRNCCPQTRRIKRVCDPFVPQQHQVKGQSHDTYP